MTVTTNQSLSVSLRKQLEQARVELQHVYDGRKVDHGRLIAAEAEKAKLVMMFRGAMSEEDIETQRRELRHKHKKLRRRRHESRTSQEDDSSCEPVIASEEAAENDIRVLDDEISRLKHQLERAALDHTNEILSKVVHSAGSGH